MKFQHCVLALSLAALFSIPALSVAQDNASQDQSQQAAPQGAPEHGRGHFDPQRRTDMLTRQLTLTSDQQAKVLDILKSEQTQMQTLHSDASLSQEDRHSKMMDIRKTSDDQIRTLLTPDQQKKFDQMQTRQWQGHRGGQGAGQGAGEGTGAGSPPPQQ
jgi:protein CpxP